MIKKFDLILVKGDSIIGEIIEEVTDSAYSHAMIALDNMHFCETDWTFPLKINHRSYPNSQIDVFRYQRELSDYEEQVMSQFIFEHLNTPYDLWQSITNGLHILFGLPIKDAKDRMNCTEVVVRMFKEAGIILGHKNDGDWTPEDLARCPLFIKVES